MGYREYNIMLKASRASVSETYLPIRKMKPSLPSMSLT